MKEFDLNDVKTSDELIKIMSNSEFGIDIKKIISALELIEHMYSGQTRVSGDTVLSHYLTVALYVYRMGLGQDSILAALLHQVINKGAKTFNQIAEEYGDDVALLVDGLTKLKTLTGVYNAEKASQEFVNLLFSASDDIRIILIRLADKLHNILTIEYLDEETKVTSARKVINIYVPIAEYLGLGSIQRLLEDAAFKVLRPQYFDTIGNYTEELFLKQTNLLGTFELEAQTLLDKYSVKQYIIQTRKKGLYSSYRKLKDKYKLNFDLIKKEDLQIMKDILAIRILVENVQDCYIVLGLLHSKYQYSKGDFEDYISSPKENGYKSVHTVIEFKGVLLEVQIRTHEMHEFNEFGPASHIAYKLKRKGIKSEDLAWTKEFNEIKQKESISKDDYKIKAFQDSIFCFTPKGKVIKLKSGSKPLDFAFRIHTHIGLRYQGALINSKMQNMDYVLKTGDIVEILTTKKVNANWNWMDNLTSANARSHLKRFLTKSSITSL